MIDKDLFKLLGKNKKYIFIVTFLQILGLLSNALITGCICYAIYLLINGKEIIEYLYPLLIALISLAIRFLASYFTDNVKDLLGRKVKKDLRSRVYSKILLLGLRGDDEFSQSTLTQTSIEGIEQLDLYYSNYIPQFFYAMIAPFILFLITVWIDYRVSLLLICSVPLIPISIVIVSKYAKRIFKKYWGKYTQMGDVFLDSLEGMKELKVLEADGRQHQKINESAEEFRKVTMKVLVMQLASTTIMDLVAYGGAGVGITLALLSTLYRGLNPVGALFLILIAIEFYLPLRAFGSSFHVAMNGLSAGKKILTLLNKEEVKRGDKKIDNYEIRLENVSFSYNKEKEVLKHINIDFKEKGLHALVGKSGCGKSTIVNLIIGTYKDIDGEIKVGNHSLFDISKEDYYSNVSFVSTDTHIFNMSIRENFKFAKDDVTDDEIKDALRKVNLLNLIDNEEGLDKNILEDSNNISGGERQRLALAINLVSNKNIYIFDEATSNIDIDSEKIIMDNIKEISKTKNVILISHRLENVVNADDIYYLEDGEIKEEGTHDSLMKLDKGYASLYKTQKALEEGYSL